MPCYILQAGDTPNVKIGWAAEDAKARLRRLQAGCWETLRLLRTVPGSRRTEVWLHRQFSDFRIARDWFRFDARMLTIDVPDISSPDLTKSPPMQIAALFGGQTAMAQAIGKSQSTVWDWVSSGRVPSARIPGIIAAAERLEPPIHLRPDHFFGVADVPAQRSAA